MAQDEEPGCARGEAGGRGGLGTVTQEKIRPTTATLSVVPSEDGKAWQAQFEWDDGRVDRVLRFERKQDAEAWIRDCYPRRIE
jgi:hypothetical protein